MLSALYQTLLYRPIYNLLVGLYDVIPGHDIGIAIILLTVLVKLVLWPITASSLKSQKALQDIQPKVDALKNKYPNKEDKDKLAKELMDLYAKEKVNPLSSCLPLLIQLPVFIALYHAMSQGLQSSGLEKLYPFVANPGTIKPVMFGFIDLANRNVVLAVLAAVSQYFQARMMVTKKPPVHSSGSADEQMLANMNKSMVYMMPVMTLVIGWQFPGGLTLYWLVSNLLTIVQQKMTLDGVKNKSAEDKPALP